MFQLTQYASVKEPKVQNQICLSEALHLIKCGDENLPLIQSARAFGKDDRKYAQIKSTLLPTFRFNFLFHDSASNQNITEPTGLLYLDADNLDEVPHSPYILACWKSLSNTGFGLLVKVDNLSLENYKDTYDQLSELLGISTDNGARKATQQTVLSHDPKLYHNSDSKVFVAQTEVSNAPISEKEKKCIGTDDTLGNWNEDSIRFNNIADYFTDDTTYIVFRDKVFICNPFIPARIEKGNRNSTLFFLLSQYALLNPKAGKPFLTSVGESINQHIYPRLQAREINSVCDSVLKKRADNTLTMHYNEERRILFNPKALLTRKEKSEIVNRELAKLKTDATRELLNYVFADWDFESHGLINQQKVAMQSGRGIATVKRYWKDFRNYVQTLNDDFKRKQEISIEQAVQGISVDKYLYNMRYKFTTMETSDERFLTKTFKERGIEYVTDKGFDEVHRFIWGIMKSRQALYRAA